jgi:ribosomal protein L11 methyltransferase
VALTVRVKVASEDVEWVSDLLWSHGVVAIEEIPAPNDIVVLRTSLGEDRSVARTTMEGLPGHLDWEFEDIDDRVVESWREHMRPFDVGESITIVPRWWTTDDNDTERRRVFIDPGATFGMGDHPTTRGCLIAMEGLDLRDRRVLDAGCGSGILGIVSLLWGARSAHGVDINPASGLVSSDNARANHVADRWSCSAIWPDEAFDLVVANILAPVLIELALVIGGRVAPSGRLILSGLLDGRHAHVVEAFSNFVVERTVGVEGWSTLVLTRR